jgi:hypothetical protein
MKQFGFVFSNSISQYAARRTQNEKIGFVFSISLNHEGHEENEGIKEIANHKSQIHASFILYPVSYIQIC